MIINRDEIQEYPFTGSFFRYEIDESLPADERVDIEILVLETPCDIQEAAKSDSGGFINVSFNIFFPFDKKVGISVKRGMTFKGSIYGMNVIGEVIGIFPNQLGGCSVYIKDVGV